MANNLELYKQLFQHAPIGIIRTTPDGRLLDINPALARMLGYRSVEENIAYPKDLERMMAYHFNRRKFEENVPIEYKFIISDRDGVKKNVFARVDMIAGTQHSVASILDVSSLKKARRHLPQAELATKEKGAILQKENLRLRTALKDSCRFGNIIGKSLAMQQVVEMILRASATDANVIICGESGTGKELVARAIHDMSDRSAKRFVPVNCGAIPRELMESEFFGYRKGGFTGADREKPGFFDSAAGGTLFLDELGDLTDEIQVKLLRVLEGGGFTPIGGVESCQPDVRIIAAANRNLTDLLKTGRMREDIFYRIHIISECLIKKIIRSMAHPVLRTLAALSFISI